MEHTPSHCRKVDQFPEERPLLAAILSLAPAYPAQNIEPSVGTKAVCGFQQFRRDACSVLWRQAALCNWCQSFSQLGRSRLKATSKMVSLLLTVTLPSRQPLHPYMEITAVQHLSWCPRRCASKAGPARPRPPCGWAFAARPGRALFTPLPSPFLLVPGHLLSTMSGAELATWQTGYVASKNVRLLYHSLSEEGDGKICLVSEGRQRWRQKEHHLGLLDLSHSITLVSPLPSLLSKRHLYFSVQIWQNFASFLLYLTWLL